jgi:hypothetical protein
VIISVLPHPVTELQVAIVGTHEHRSMTRLSCRFDPHSPAEVSCHVIPSLPRETGLGSVAKIGSSALSRGLSSSCLQSFIERRQDFVCVPGSSGRAGGENGRSDDASVSQHSLQTCLTQHAVLGGRFEPLNLIPTERLCPQVVPECHAIGSYDDR